MESGAAGLRCYEEAFAPCLRRQGSVHDGVCGSDRSAADLAAWQALAKMGPGKSGEGFRLAPEFWRPRDDLELTELSIFRGSHRFPTLQEPKNDLVSCPTSGSYMVLVSIEVHSSFPGLSEQPRVNRATQEREREKGKKIR